jgi:glycosyltransferase involved in cell wall biosynthesis
LLAIASACGVEDRVVLHGLAPDPRPLHAGIDIFVHPSETEGLPNAVLEAAAAGLPIVATDAGGTREIVIDGTTGLLVPVGDGAALGAAIMKLVDDPDLRANLGSAARRHAEETFGMSRFVAETAALYERLVREKRSA